MDETTTAFAALNRGSHASTLHWKVQGTGPNLVLLHGWGMNGAVWEQVAEELSHYFTLYMPDMPGYGHSHHCQCDDIETIARLILDEAPDQAIWLGWSLGGLIATHIALNYPQRVSQLVTLASSPRFAAEGTHWRGIAPQVLDNFTLQLTEDFQGTIDRFMALQAMGSPSARQDTRQIKEAVLSRPTPDPRALRLGLNLLGNVDYRSEIKQLQTPLHRWYGRLDGLVPARVARMLDQQLQTESYIFTQSSHAPFISERTQFCELMKSLVTA